MLIGIIVEWKWVWWTECSVVWRSSMKRHSSSRSRTPTRTYHGLRNTSIRAGERGARPLFDAYDNTKKLHSAALVCFQRRSVSIKNIVFLISTVGVYLFRIRIFPFFLLPFFPFFGGGRVAGGEGDWIISDNNFDSTFFPRDREGHFSLRALDLTNFYRDIFDERKAISNATLSTKITHRNEYIYVLLFEFLE